MKKIENINELCDKVRITVNNNLIILKICY
jgi:hypothetical protein